MNNAQSIFTTAASSVLSQIANALPVVFGALAIFVVGIFVSNWAKKITVVFLRTIKLDKLFKDTGIKKFLKKSQLPHGLEELLGQVIRWILLLIFFIATVNVLGLTSVSEVLVQILAYVPNVISATLILALGIFLAGILEGMVKGAMSSVSGRAARTLGKITSYTIVIFASLAAISELKIAEQFIQTLFTGVVATLTLALGLALGLGSKDTVSKMVKDWYKSSKK